MRYVRDNDSFLRTYKCSNSWTNGTHMYGTSDTNSTMRIHCSMKRTNSTNEFTAQRVKAKNFGEKRSRRVSDLIVIAIIERFLSEFHSFKNLIFRKGHSPSRIWKIEKTVIHINYLLSLFSMTVTVSDSVRIDTRTSGLLCPFGALTRVSSAIQTKVGLENFIGAQITSRSHFPSPSNRINNLLWATCLLQML
jgi:hypothetical protein